MRIHGLTVLVICLLAGSVYATSREELEPCHISQFPQEVLCGSHEVYEDRASQSGRQITINFAVIPAVISASQPDPLVILPGGPGQAALDMGPLVRVAFSEVLQNRDIVLVDQRGMGSSHPLDCTIAEFTNSDLASDISDERTRDLLMDCLSSLDADVRLYTQDIANQDLHEILLALGYTRINIYGVSWGTRAALLYSQQFPQQLRTMILDGNAPLTNKVPLFAAQDAERALRMAFDDCAHDPACSEAYPNLVKDFDAALVLFGDQGVNVSVADPTTNRPLEFNLKKNQFVNNLRNILYSTDLVRLLPLVVEQASHGDYRALAGITSYLNERQEGGMSLGASLTILCSEELQRISTLEIDTQSRTGFLDTAFVDIFSNACSVWPKADVPDIYRSPGTSSVPTLILSGEADPVTPPRWGEKMSETFTNSLHLVASKTAHNVAPAKCAGNLMATFIDQANFANLDGSCLSEIKRPAFFTSASGPTGSTGND